VLIVVSSKGLEIVCLTASTNLMFQLILCKTWHVGRSFALLELISLLSRPSLYSGFKFWTYLHYTVENVDEMQGMEIMEKY